MVAQQQSRNSLARHCWRNIALHSQSAVPLALCPQRQPPPRPEGCNFGAGQHLRIYFDFGSGIGSSPILRTSAAQRGSERMISNTGLAFARVAYSSY